MQILQEGIPDLLRWYTQVKRELPWRVNADAYRIWISEIMLQQTRIEAVKPYFDRFLAAFPDVSALAEAPEERVLKVWEGLGYYSRARNLQKAAQICVEKYGGRVPSDYEQLRALPGIGNYTAGAIGSIAFGLPVPAVDGNVLRVLSRIFGDAREMNGQKIRTEMEQLIRDVIPEDCPGTFNEAIMELGETICVPKGRPYCETCPWRQICQAYIQGNPEDYPVKAPKKARRVEQRTVLLLQMGEELALRQRPETGLLAGLYEFPCLDGHWREEDLCEWTRGMHREILCLGEAKHVFSHVEWHMVGYKIFLHEALPGDWFWVKREALEKHYPLPTAYQAYRKYLKNELGIEK